MRMLIATTAMCLIVTSAQAQEPCSVVANATVIADDGEFLGMTSNQFNSRSIFNEFGSYGSEFSGKSIWNNFGKYGGEFSALSPFNRFSMKPPAIVKSGKVIGYLTVNTSVRGGLNPHYLKTCEF